MMTELQLDALRDELKSYLNVTWVEDDDDLLNYVKDGISYLNGKAGTDIDFESHSEARRLLMDYGRYVYNHSLELFKINFEGELFELSLREGLKSYETSDTETST